MKELKFESKTFQFVRNETPFQVIKFPEHRLELFWTKGRVYGPQVLAVLFNPKAETRHFYKTTGWGYCKISEATTHALRFAGLKVKGMKDHDQIPWNYKIGGNFYRVVSEDLEG